MEELGKRDECIAAMFLILDDALGGGSVDTSVRLRGLLTKAMQSCCLRDAGAIGHMVSSSVEEMRKSESCLTDGKQHAARDFSGSLPPHSKGAPPIPVKYLAVDDEGARSSSTTGAHNIETDGIVQEPHQPAISAESNPYTSTSVSGSLAQAKQSREEQRVDAITATQHLGENSAADHSIISLKRDLKAARKELRLLRQLGRSLFEQLRLREGLGKDAHFNKECPSNA